MVNEFRSGRLAQVVCLSLILRFLDDLCLLSR